MQARPSPAPRAAGGMKWWGWGLEGVAFTHEDKPELRGFIERVLALDVARPTTRPTAFDELTIAEPALGDALRDALEDVRGSVPGPPEIRGDFAQDLADELNTTKAKVEAALERIRDKHEAEMTERRDALAEALAKKLNLDVDKVKDALEAPKPPFGRPGP
jgi:hypothetical protein